LYSTQYLRLNLSWTFWNFNNKNIRSFYPWHNWTSIFCVGCYPDN
jgi:hypothetical protein